MLPLLVLVARATLSPMPENTDPSAPPLVRTRAMRQAEQLTVAAIRWRFVAAVVIAVVAMLSAVALLTLLA